MNTINNTNDNSACSDSVACSNCYTGEAYAKPGATCAWCGAPRGVCGDCGAASSALRLCAECGLHEESVHELARRIHVVQAGEDGERRSEKLPTRTGRLASGGYRSTATVEAIRPVVIRRVVQLGLAAVEQELGLSELESIPAELHTRVAAIAARSPDTSRLVARRARQLAPMVAVPRTRVLGSACFIAPTAEEVEMRDRARLEHGLRLLEQELGVTTP